MAKIFISHSSLDKDIVDLFKNIILNAGLGILDKDIAYTSAPETGVPTGGNIPRYIKENIADSDFVFFMISDNYRKSEICLNEMGTAWALDKNVKPLLLHNVSFKSVGWLYGMNLCAKINDAERLDELRDEFLDKYDFCPKTVAWNRCRNQFLDSINDNGVNTEDHDVATKGFLEYNIEFNNYKDAYNKAVEDVNCICNFYITQQLNPLIKKFNKVTTNISCQKKFIVDVVPILEGFANSLNPCVDAFVDTTIHLVNNAISIYTYPTISGVDKQTFKSVIINILKDFDCAKNIVVNCRECFYKYPSLENRQIKANNKIIEDFTKIIIAIDDCINKLNRIY